MSEWKTIETAPRDGKTILVWGPEAKSVFTDWWSNGKWFDASFDGRELTHWMPLPEPPQ